MDVRPAPASIPLGCICSYTWSVLPGHLVRNGALTSCPADHTAVDGH